MQAVYLQANIVATIFGILVRASLCTTEQQKWTTCPVKIAIFGGLGGSPKFLLPRNPCKNLKSSDNPFWGKSNGTKKKKKKKRKEKNKRRKNYQK